VFFAPDNYSDVLGIAWFHTFFNLLGVLLFFPFIPLLVKWLHRIFPDKAAPNTLFIQNVSFDLPEASLNALKREIRHLYSLTLILLEHIVHVKHAQYQLATEYKYFADYLKQNPASNTLHQIDKLRKLQAAIATYAINIKQQELELQDVKQLHQLIHVAMGLQQLHQLATGLLDDRENLQSSTNVDVQELMRQLHSRFSGYLREFHYEWEEGHQLLDIGIAPDLLSQRLEADYDQFISQISTLLADGKIESRHATALLSLNGLLTQCFRQVFKLFEPLKQVENQLLHSNGNG
jgi:phosphate:Na+ symporter